MAANAQGTGSSSIEKLPAKHVDFQARQMKDEEDRAMRAHVPKTVSPDQGGGPMVLGQNMEDSVPKKRATFAEDTVDTSQKIAQSSFNNGLRRDSSMLRSQMTVNNLLTFVSKGGERRDRPDGFAHDVESIRKRLKDINKRTIDPRSTFVKYWDILTVSALAFTAFVTPFEVGFFEGGGGYSDAPITFVLNRVIDAVVSRNPPMVHSCFPSADPFFVCFTMLSLFVPIQFVCDVVVSFFLPYRAPHRKGGMMIYDNKRIAIAYLKGWASDAANRMRCYVCTSPLCD